MRGQSHKRLGEYLARKYMSGIPKRYVRAFLIGCVEPDRNPATYLKGSIKFQWLRGHNYRNARSYMGRLSRRLENRSRLRLLDYYAIGKLIHYTTDSFTSAHNAYFPTRLEAHREYEAMLQNYFLNFLSQDPPPSAVPCRRIMDTIRAQHRDYSRFPADIRTDTRFAFAACCCIAETLLGKPLQAAPAV